MMEARSKEQWRNCTESLLHVLNLLLPLRGCCAEKHTCVCLFCCRLGAEGCPSAQKRLDRAGCESSLWPLCGGGDGAQLVVLVMLMPEPDDVVV